MTAPFKSTYNKTDAFHLRVEHLREEFGEWDACDPVSHAILDVVEAQRILADLFLDDARYGLGSKAAFEAAFAKREAAAERLLKAIKDRKP